MEPDEINAIIAEYCGWTYTGPEDMKFIAHMCWVRPGRNSWQTECIPNYCESLDLMYDAEECLGDDIDMWMRYDRFLAEGPRTGFTWHVQPSDKAEAFVRAINKWIEN